jgi:hypothetical protein
MYKDMKSPSQCHAEGVTTLRLLCAQSVHPSDMVLGQELEPWLGC